MDSNAKNLVFLGTFTRICKHDKNHKNKTKITKKLTYK
jgi:hypothetical protein